MNRLFANMQPEVSSTFPPPARAVYTGAWGVAAVLSAMALAGWMSGYRDLASLSPHFSPMAPISAILLLLASLALGARRAPASIRSGLFPIVGLAALITLGLGTRSPLDPTLPTHMSLVTGIALVFVGIARLPGPRSHPWRDLIELLGAIPAVIGGFVVIGYLYQDPLLFRGDGHPVALTTGIALTCLGLGLMVGKGTDGLPLRFITGPSARARMLRAFLPSVPVAVVVDALFVRLVPVPSHAVRITLFGILLVGVAVAGMLRAAHVLGGTLDSMMESLTARERELRAIFNGTDEAMVIVDDSAVCIDVNAAGTDLFGRTAESIVGRDLHKLLAVKTGPLGTPAALRHYHSDSGAIQVSRPDGSKREVEFSLTSNVLPGRHLATIRDVTESRRRLIESERLAAIVGSTTDAIYSKDLAGRIISWNPAASRIFGYEEGEVLGKTEGAIGLLPARIGLAPLAANGHDSERELTAQRKDGRRVTLSITESPVRDGTGRTIGTSVIARDVTLQREAERSLAEHQQQLRAFFHSRAVGILFGHSDGRILDANDAFLDMIGYPRAELDSGSLRWTEITPADFREADAEAVAEGRRFGSCRPYEKQFLRRDGTPIWVLIGFVLMEPDRKRSVAFVVDIDEKKRTEAAFRHSEERFSRLFESSPVAVTMSAVESGRVVDVNDRWCELTGFDRAEAIGHGTDELGLWVDLELRRRMVRTLDQSHPAASAETELRRKSGEVRYVLVSMAAINISSASEQMMIVTIVDLTERRSLEQQLLQSQKMEAIGRLAGGVAHDFNNMLGVILGFSELLATTISREEQPKVEQIINASKRAAGLTGQLLAFSRKQLLAPRIIDPNELVRGIADMLRRLIGEDVRLETALDPVAGHITADQGQLEQVIVNLAVNARDAMPTGGTLAISTANEELDEARSPLHEPVVPGPYVMISVSDTGTGIDPDTMAHLFEPFFTTKGSGKGTGLGLSTVYGIIRQSEGYIWVDSELGAGSTFKIFLPRVEAPVDRPLSDPKTRVVAGDEMILLVEDEPDLRAMIAEALRLEGYRVITAENGAAAMDEALRYQEEIRLLVTDVIMPGMNGGELASKLLDCTPSLKVLFISGYASDLSILGDMLTRGENLLTKPFAPNALLRRVRDLLDEVD